MADIANSMLNSFVFCKNMKLQSLQEDYPNSEIFLVFNFPHSGCLAETYSVNVHIQSEYEK